MQVVLLRVGIDLGAGGLLGPLYGDQSFEFIPIPDGFDLDERTYGTTSGKHGQRFCDYFPPGRRDAMRRKAMHVDPEFETFTYGDPTRLKSGLRRLTSGDLLVFYAGLVGHGCAALPALYIVGYFDVDLASRARDLTEDIIAGKFGANFHVRHPRVYAAQRECLVLVKGKSTSRLLSRAERISELDHDAGGHPIYVLSHKMQRVFGSFTKLNAIQRSAPRWVHPDFVEQAAGYVRSLP